MADLDRFRTAQDAPHAGYLAALSQLRAGRKTGHWIWYVFPQLAGLGQSATSAYYGLAGPDEAAAYLRDPVLGARLLEAATVVRGHVGGAHGVRLERLMGSEIDALKLVSCMTLFAHVARALHDAQPRPEFAAMVETSEAVLTATARQGYARCAFTEQALRGWQRRGL